MPIDCSTIQNPEERAHCLLIQNRLIALRAVDRSVPGSFGPHAAGHLAVAATCLESAECALELAAADGER